MASWRNEVLIKKYFTQDSSDEIVTKLIDILVPQLNRILFKEHKRITNKLESCFLDDFEEVIEDFKWIKTAINNNEDPNEFDFDSWTEAFDEYLDKLYDLGDTITRNGSGLTDIEKFLWVK